MVINVDKYVIIDSKMRKEEKDFIRCLGYNLIEINKSKDIYEEISSHVDIFSCKINDKIILEKNLYNKIIKETNLISDNKLNKIICGNSIIKGNYPNDIAYNVCKIGNNVIHNFKYTDKVILDVIKKEKLNMININQGYSNCSIAVIDDNSAIVTDKKIAQKLKENKIDVLLLEGNLDIKLLKNNGDFSNMKGFIGGCIAKIEDKIILFGDINKIEQCNKIKEFVKSKGLEFIDFKNINIVDYGGILII